MLQGVAVSDNYGKVLLFDVDGIRCERRLVARPAEDIARELSASSPVGRALVSMQVGDSVTVKAPAGDVVVKVLKARSS